LPEVIQKNIHIFMVLVKNVLDLKTDSLNLNTAPNDSITRILKLKREGLIFL
jgi:hypothetical protein